MISQLTRERDSSEAASSGVAKSTLRREFMLVEVITTVIAPAGAIVVVGLSYWFTKKREREAELRKEKLEHYKDFVANHAAVVAGGSEKRQEYAIAANKLNLIAPRDVIKALQNYLPFDTDDNSRRSGEEDYVLLSKLLYEMRKDLGITPKDQDKDLMFRLWG
jgi:hypothetical protein